MKLNRLSLWILKLKQKYFSKKPEEKRCYRCGNQLNSSYYIDYNIETNITEYICEECENKLNEYLKKRDEKFQEKCPLHKNCALWCDNCEKYEECYNGKY